jgi:regulator of protease activity HflC (stomatin/prohibitin superfamily)
MVAAVIFAVVFVATLTWLSPVTITVAVAAGLIGAAGIRIAPQWERVAILRLGRFHRVAGPGPYPIIPFFEYAAIHVDQRVMTSSFSAEAALTSDLVPVDVDAILFWMVWDAERACLEVKNYPKAVLWSAQTALRDALGQTNLADLSTRRRQIDHELKAILEKKCEDWGITVLSVEIRDIMVPRALQDALSKEAQAARERDARIILAETEKDISELYVEAASVYRENPVAVQLRAMNLAYEGAKDGNGMFLMPSQLADSFDLSQILKGE